MKKNRIIPLMLAISLVAASPLAFASNNTATANSGDISPATEKVVAFCPAIDQLEKAPDRTWKVGSAWKSFTPSFVEKIAHFYGAQWGGAKVGQITCVYKGTDPSSFPILLVYHDLIEAPSGGKWKHEKTVMNCYSRDRRQCAFKPPAKLKEEDIFKSLEHAKDNPHLYQPI